MPRNYRYLEQAYSKYVSNYFIRERDVSKSDLSRAVKKWHIKAVDLDECVGLHPLLSQIGKLDTRIKMKEPDAKTDQKAIYELNQSIYSGQTHSTERCLGLSKPADKK